MSCTSVPVCKSEQRRHQVREKEGLNGLDYLEVSEDQLTLTLYFLGKAPSHLEKENIRIQGGRRITDIRVTHLYTDRWEDPETDDCVHITVDRYGDFSTYCLYLVEIDEQTKKPVIDIDEQGRKQFRPMPGIDPRYCRLEFSFKAGCPSDLDCKQQAICLPERPEEPEINYLAKDFAGFRQLILDRLALIMPDWRERHVPDLGITLVELLAYAGDHLSYYQDAVATEAYLDTARRRISVRRHARLVDYQLHEGCNARAWVTLQVSSDLAAFKPADFYLITDPGISAQGHVLEYTQLPGTLPKPYLVFEPLVENREKDIALYADHNEIKIYTWGDAQCCLPKGSASVTLTDPGTATPIEPENPGECGLPGGSDSHYGDQPAVSPLDSDYRLKLNPGDIIIFEEVKGPRTGNPADADPSHRHAARLTRAKKTQDPLNGQLIWEIEWATEDALPFPLCISSVTGDCLHISDISVVRGNVLLVDHGERVNDELEPVPLKTIQTECSDNCTPRETVKIAGGFRPILPKPGVTFSQPLSSSDPIHRSCTPVSRLAPASALMKQDVRQALPEVKLNEIRPVPDESGITDQLIWEPRPELLGSEADDRHFVVEMEDDRRAHIRFGNGESGRFPDAQTQFQATYRVGNGVIGNVGAEAITHIIFRDNLPDGVDIVPRNPLPAAGGTDPEPAAEARLFAPHAFRKELQRAITADDYARIVMRDFGSKVQRAAATLRWTGSWFEVLVAIDPAGSEDTDEELLHEIKHHLCRYRRIGHDVVVVQASYISLDIAMTVCVLPHYLRGHVKSELLNVFSSRVMADGGKGFFHPDNLSFGGGIYLSKLVAAAQAVAGVESVVVKKMERFLVGPNQEIENGFLPLGPFEVARLENNPSFPENGKFTLDMRGGR
jgi:hypothetical protein